ncbi:MAG: HigA family addiction module antidote protein [Alphaproteobacteria bacterium]|nr:HigA family addiction module antidote protein [Alphaproteobacteria bacterium]
MSQRPSRSPTHPGAILRDDVLPALGVSVSEAARELGISRQLLHGILAERTRVSPEMAHRLGKWCGNGPDLWSRLQTTHDLWASGRVLAAKLKSIPTRRAA